jgi:hypothetical protein
MKSKSEKSCYVQLYGMKEGYSVSGRPRFESVQAIMLDDIED